MKSYIRIIFRFIKAHKIVAVFLVSMVLGAGIASAVTGGAESPTDNTEALPQVQTASIAELASGASGLPLIGIVESIGEADIQTERSGSVTAVYYGLGDYVKAGATIASLENAAERASVAQAQAAFAAAQANYAQVSGRNDRTSDAARADAVRAYKSAFITAEDAVENKTEPFFDKDRTAYPNLLVPSDDSEKLEKARVEISDRFRVWERALKNIEQSEDLLPYLMQAQSDLRFIESFLTGLASDANRRTNTDSELAVTDAQRAALLAARSSVNAELASLIAIESAWRSSISGSISGSTGEFDAELAAAQASVAQAQANLDVARASLAKTLITSPISGYINALDLKVGDSLGAFTPVVSVINPGALEVTAYISPNDRSRVEQGDAVTLDGGVRGVITRIAPGISNRTGKIEIRIAPEGDTSMLTAGNSVSVVLAQSAQNNVQTVDGVITIPLTAIKFKSDEAVIFTVDEENRLVEHSVVLGRVLGNQTEVQTNLPFQTPIVVDARGLLAGDLVEVAE